MLFSLRSSCAAAVGAAFAVATAGPAMAVTWGSSSSPIVAYQSGVAQAKAYGNYFNENSQYARNDSQQADLKPGGNAVFVNTIYRFYKSSPQCGMSSACFAEVDRISSPATTSAAWSGGWTRRSLDAASTSTRGETRVCERVNNRPDPCSAPALPTFSY